jgi:hypothetical protein
MAQVSVAFDEAVEILFVHNVTLVRDEKTVTKDSALEEVGERDRASGQLVDERNGVGDETFAAFEWRRFAAGLQHV